MLRSMLRAKIHRATVTDADLGYEGSLTVDLDLLEAADIAVHERVHVANITNGERFETYIFEGERGSGVICANGAAARLAFPGDEIIVMAYGLVEEHEVGAHAPKIILVDKQNRIAKVT